MTKQWKCENSGKCGRIKSCPHAEVHQPVQMGRFLGRNCTSVYHYCPVLDKTVTCKNIKL